MRVFMTGTTGFVGSHVARILLSRGHEVHALMRPDTDAWRLDAPTRKSLHTVDGALEDETSLRAYLRSLQPELCLHLAWYAEPGKYLTSPRNLELVAITVRLASFLAELGCRRFIGVGTCVEYDTRAGYLSESTPVRPQTLYAACKLSLHLILERLPSMQTAWLRLFYLYGPYEDERRLVPSVIQSLLRGERAAVTPGEQVRDFLHVEDVASAAVAVAESTLVGAVNIGSGQPITVRQVAQTIGEVMQRPDLIALGARPYDVGDPMFICADNSRLRTQTSWTPRYTLQSGLRHTVEWWQNHSLQVKGGSHGSS